MLISTEQLTQQIQESGSVIVDCRFSLADANAGQNAYLQGHIPGAVYADLDKDLSSPITANSGRHPLPDIKRFSETLGAWGVHNDSHVVAYDDMGGAVASRLWWLLKWLGHEKVSLLDGGWNRWQQEQRPVSNEPGSNSPQTYLAKAEASTWVTTAQVEEDMAAQRICLVDARATPRFLGKEEPLDAVAGHVPGAVNRPMQLNLGGDGGFLPAEDLREQFAALVGDTAVDAVVHMCGSGVTACHNLFAMELAGLRGSRLYVGSWSEWIRDSRRDIVRE
ncbi:MAG: sulfurtransferase [Gammaproteobacteria bacterium]|nr:sulfurtransferase [Gammaproteobacteria bacterium]MDH5803126.1 sulfurtransferase [Gammaproteobacteria bacterium]